MHMNTFVISMTHCFHSLSSKDRKESDSDSNSEKQHAHLYVLSKVFVTNSKVLAGDVSSHIAVSFTSSEKFFKVKPTLQYGYFHTFVNTKAGQRLRLQ